MKRIGRAAQSVSVEYLPVSMIDLGAAAGSCEAGSCHAKTHPMTPQHYIALTRSTSGIHMLFDAQRTPHDRAPGLHATTFDTTAFRRPERESGSYFARVDGPFAPKSSSRAYVLNVATPTTRVDTRARGLAKSLSAPRHW